MGKSTFVVHFVGGETLTITDADPGTFDNIAIGKLTKIGDKRILTSNITFIEEYEQGTQGNNDFYPEDDEENSYVQW